MPSEVDKKGIKDSESIEKSKKGKKVLTKGDSGDIINKLTRERGKRQRKVLKNFFEKIEKRY